MHKIDWYIIKKFLGSFFAAIALIIIIVVIFDISEKLDNFLEKDVPLHAIIWDYYVNFIPYFVNMFSSLFIFIAVIFFTSRLAQNTEIVPILSSGISFYRLMVPYILCALLIGSLNLVLANFVIPDVNKDRIAFERLYIKKSYQNANTNIHLQFDSNTYYYVESFDNRADVGYRFSFEKIEGNRLLEKLNARNIRFDSAKNVWILNDYVSRVLLADGEQVERGRRKEIDLPVRPLDFAADYVKVDEQNYHQLNQLIKKEKLRGSSLVVYYRYERLQRFLHPLSAVILTLIGLSLSSHKTRRGMGRNLAAGIALAFTFILFMQISKVFATSGTMPVWTAALLPVFIYGVIAAYLVRIAPK
ncbi:MAG: LptF/LptG family permease [Bacteroidales bacterium]|nr:LptF/LptG family permease [Bacteroidales bacterium]MDE7071847.1 LptF/LptG family permease [Bacteroidales bacterium]